MPSARQDKRPIFSGLAAVTLVAGLFIDILGPPESLAYTWAAEFEGVALALYAIAAGLFFLGFFGGSERGGR